MKKLLFLFFIGLFTITKFNAQELKSGISIGYPFGSIGENFSVFTGIDVAYSFEITDNIQLGATTGYGRYFYNANVSTEDQTDIQLEGGDFSYIPVAATAKYSVGRSYNWFGGADLGYAFSIGSESTKDLSGLSYVIKAGWQNELFEIFGFYRGIGNSETKTKTSGSFTSSTTFAKLGSAGVGVSYKF